MKGLHKPVHEVFNTIYRHESKSDAQKCVALADVSRALHYSKQRRDPVVTLFEINDRESMKQGKSSILLSTLQARNVPEAQISVHEK